MREKIWVHLGWCPLAPKYPKETWREFWKTLDKNAKAGLIISAVIGTYLVTFIGYVITQLT